MPHYAIRIVNSDFSSSSSIEARDPEEARAKALKGALQIGSAEVSKGSPFFGATIDVRQGEQTVGRMIVAIGTSTLQLTP